MFPIAIIFSDLATRILNRHNACNVSVVTVKSVCTEYVLYNTNTVCVRKFSFMTLLFRFIF